ncbi:MAG TPA: hypothetical protein VG897_00515 [Terriglobales bacterium]|nr:hypothetical protein [Terriglobales bacterium]
MGEPVLTGLLFADRLAQELGGKWSISGTFSVFQAPQVPASFPPWYIYAAVANLEGEHSFTLNLVHDQTSHVALSVSGQFQVSEPKFGVELAIPVFHCVFPHFGDYNLLLLVDNQPLAGRVLEVRQAPPRTPQA